MIFKLIDSKYTTFLYVDGVQQAVASIYVVYTSERYRIDMPAQRQPKKSKRGRVPLSKIGELERIVDTNGMCGVCEHRLALHRKSFRSRYCMEPDCHCSRRADGFSRANEIRAARGEFRTSRGWGVAIMAGMDRTKHCDRAVFWHKNDAVDFAKTTVAAMKAEMVLKAMSRED